MDGYILTYYPQVQLPPYRQAGPLPSYRLATVAAKRHSWDTAQGSRAVIPYPRIGKRGEGVGWRQ